RIKRQSRRNARTLPIDDPDVGTGSRILSCDRNEFAVRREIDVAVRTLFTGKAQLPTCSILPSEHHVRGQLSSTGHSACGTSALKIEKRAVLGDTEIATAIGPTEV